MLLKVTLSVELVINNLSEMKKNVYQTTCIETSAVLITSNIPLFSMEQIAPRRYEFVFERDGDRLDKVLEMYHRQQLSLPAYPLLANLKFLKTQVKNR